MCPIIIMENVEEILKGAGIQLTAIRIMIYKEIVMYDGAFSLSDIEQHLMTLDTSTIFRTLSLFLKKRLLHEIDDGSGSKKYCLCQCKDGSHKSHVHFACLNCHKVYCIKDIVIQQVELPVSFKVADINYVMKGFCPNCQKRI